MNTIMLSTSFQYTQYCLTLEYNCNSLIIYNPTFSLLILITLMEQFLSFSQSPQSVFSWACLLYYCTRKAFGLSSWDQILTSPHPSVAESQGEQNWPFWGSIFFLRCQSQLMYVEEGSSFLSVTLPWDPAWATVKKDVLTGFMCHGRSTC